MSTKEQSPSRPPLLNRSVIQVAAAANAGLGLASFALAADLWKLDDGLSTPLLYLIGALCSVAAFVTAWGSREVGEGGWIVGVVAIDAVVTIAFIATMILSWDQITLAGGYFAMAGVSIATLASLATVAAALATKDVDASASPGHQPQRFPARDLRGQLLSPQLN
ncbi:hypothetical protein [Nocardia salmonicida]|uniref:hypothetical protein n=1 Tax=Nocardia salmonicida TaxID=53431 RepID=UPI0007A4E464|nr:hypothetical protein [Nocardia salmonicida]